MWLLSGDFSSLQGRLSIELSTTWQLASPTVNNRRKGKRDRQTDKHTKREATVSFYKFGSNLLSLLPYWSHRPTLAQWRRGHSRVVPEGRAH